MNLEKTIEKFSKNMKKNGTQSNDPLENFRQQKEMQSKIKTLYRKFILLCFITNLLQYITLNSQSDDIQSPSIPSNQKLIKLVVQSHLELDQLPSKAVLLSRNRKILITNVFVSQINKDPLQEKEVASVFIPQNISKKYPNFFTSEYFLIPEGFDLSQLVTKARQGKSNEFVF
jgi:hypothetical protein